MGWLDGLRLAEEREPRDHKQAKQDEYVPAPGLRLRKMDVG
jgi:hypothetical protein